MRFLLRGRFFLSSLFVLCLCVGCPETPKDTAPYSDNPKAAYWYGMIVHMRLKRCVDGLKGTNRWQNNLERYFWAHPIPEGCAEVRTIAETMKPALGEEE